MDSVYGFDWYTVFGTYIADPPQKLDKKM